MTLATFIRDTAYFQSRRDQQRIINAEDFDAQFNNLAAYLNNKMRPVINNLFGREVPGTDEEDTADTFLRNIGDGNTEWVPINNDAVDDYAIAFAKFTQKAAGSIFATGNDRVFKAVTPLDADQILVSTTDNLPVWRKLQNDNFDDRAILGRHIDYNSIGLELLSPQITGRPLDAGSILERHIVDGSILGAKIADSAITDRHIDPAIIDLRNTSIGNNRYNIPAGSLENRHFPDSFFTGPTRRQESGVDDNVNYTFTSDNIIDNSLTANLLPQPNLGGGIGIQTERSFADGAILPRHIIAGSFPKFFPYNSIGILTNIRKEKLNWQIRSKLGI